VAINDGTFEKIQQTPATATMNPSITVHTKQGLESATLYKIRVSAVNRVGEGPLSHSIEVIAADMPSKPTQMPEATLVTQTSVNLKLEALPEEQNGGSAITGYLVEIDDGLGGAFELVHNSLNLELIVTQLEPSRHYRVRYAARNLIYDSGNMFECDQLQYSETLVVHTAIAPTTPRNLEHTNSLRYRDALIFSWQAPLSDGGSKLQHYTLQIDSQDFSETHIVSVQAGSFKFDDLTPATTYSVKIKVNNLVG
jgi:hypothetical protein